jgi:hypothetical protein
MKSIRLALAGSAMIALFLVSYLALSAEPKDVPPGIAPENWVAIGDELGLVLVADSSLVEVPDGFKDLSGQRRSDRPLLRISGATGYLMVKRNGRWSHVEIVRPKAQ